MGVIVVTVGLFAVAALVAFFFFKPEYNNQKVINTFNACWLFVTALLAIGFVFYINNLMAGTIHDKLWKPVAMAGSLAITFVLLTLGLLLRNFWLFKPPKRPTF